jgi:hypothetical protein
MQVPMRVTLDGVEYDIIQKLTTARSSQLRLRFAIQPLPRKEGTSSNI